MPAGHVTELNKSLESLENEMILTHPLTHSPHLTAPPRLTSPHYTLALVVCVGCDPCFPCTIFIGAKPFLWGALPPTLPRLPCAESTNLERFGC